MNWEAIGAIGEIFGGLAVLITLVYLARQIKQSTRSQSIATYEAALSGYNNVQTFCAGDVESASIWRRGATEPTALNEDEQVRFEMMVRNYANQVYKLLRLYEHDVFPESEWIKTIDEAKQLFRSPGFAEFKQGNNYFADLWSEMDSRVLNPISTFSGTSASLTDSP